MDNNDKYIDNEKFGEEPEPLNRQELSILQQIKASVMKAEENFAKWQRDCGNRKPSATVKFEAKVEGESLGKLKFMQIIVNEGYRMISSKEIAARIIELGIDVLYAQLMQSKIQSVIHSQIITGLPPELRDAIVTVEMRNAIKSYIKAINEGSSMADLLDEKAPVDDKNMPQCEKGKCGICNKPVGSIDNKTVVSFKGNACHSDCVLDSFKKKDSDSDKEV